MPTESMASVVGTVTVARTSAGDPSASKATATRTRTRRTNLEPFRLISPLFAPGVVVGVLNLAPHRRHNAVNVLSFAHELGPNHGLGAGEVARRQAVRLALAEFGKLLVCFLLSGGRAEADDFTAVRLAKGEPLLRVSAAREVPYNGESLQIVHDAHTFTSDAILA